MRDIWDEVTSVPPLIWKSVLVVAVLIVAVIVNRSIARVLRRAHRQREERAIDVTGVEELARLQRQRTLVTLLESFVRYTVYGAALVAMVNVAFPDFVGTTVVSVSVLLAFALQRFLGDVIAGALLIFEGQFAVGDVITVHTHNVTGTVERVGLRTTTLRTPSDERVVILNGVMNSITRWPHGQREYRFELLVRGASAAEHASRIVAREAGAPGSLWVHPPALEIVEQFPDDDIVRLRAHTTIHPEHEHLVQRLATVIEAELDEDSLIGDALVLPLSEQTYDVYRTGLLVRE